MLIGQKTWPRVGGTVLPYMALVIQYLPNAVEQHWPSWVSCSKLFTRGVGLQCVEIKKQEKCLKKILFFYSPHQNKQRYECRWPLKLQVKYFQYVCLYTR